MLPPEQKVCVPLAEIVGVEGKEFTVIIVATDTELLHPLPFVTLTV